MIHKQIEKLVLLMCNDFITYPLLEEGKCVPFVNICKCIELERDVEIFNNKIKELFNEKSYEVIHSLSEYSNTAHYYEIYPNYKDLDGGSYEFVNPDWSIEEILDLIFELSKN